MNKKREASQEYLEKQKRQREITKKYLLRAFRADKRINNKIEQKNSLNDLAARITSTQSKIPPSGTKNVHKIQDTIVKIIALEEEIDSDIDILVDLKSELTHLFKKIDNTKYQTLLESRYLNFQKWERIAVDMDYSIRHTYEVHDEALDICYNLIFKNRNKEISNK